MITGRPRSHSIPVLCPTLLVPPHAAQGLQPTSRSGKSRQVVSTVSVPSGDHLQAGRLSTLQWPTQREVETFPPDSRHRPLVLARVNRAHGWAYLDIPDACAVAGLVGAENGVEPQRAYQNKGDPLHLQSL